MKQNKLKSSIRKFTPQKKRAVAEVISSLLLVVITVAGAILIASFLGESFVSSSMALVSSSDTTIKSIQLRAFDTRDGIDLFGYPFLDNSVATDGYLCRDAVLSLIANPLSVCTSNANKSPANGGTSYVVIQIENRDINPIWVSDVYLDGVGHTWDATTAGVDLDGSVNPDLGTGEVPRDGMFSILPADIADTTQNQDNQVRGGQTVNLVVKLDSVNPDIPLSKTIRVQLNTGANQLQEFLIESGGAQ